jgi:anthranilate phosphoribosyltransferase
MVGIDFAADPIIDTCGTGGDGSLSVNVSTIAAFLVAGAGVVVAKHGNRAQSSRSGSHDVIEALGLDPAPKPDVAARCLREAKLAFLFAPAHHAATKHVGGPRKEVGVRTIFNLLGPLTNPAGAKFHVNGIFARERCEILAQAHGALGSKRAMVVHGAGGLDEFAPSGSTFVAELGDGGVKTRELKPSDFGLDESDPAGLRGGLPDDNARIALDVLRGGGPEAARNATLMTAGAAIFVAGAAPTLQAATAKASVVLEEGGGMAVLETLRRIAPRQTPAS